MNGFPVEKETEVNSSGTKISTPQILKHKKIYFIAVIVFIIFFVPLLLLNIIKPSSSPTLEKESQKKAEKPVVAEPLIPRKQYDSKLQNGPFSCPTISSVCKNGTYKENTLSGSINKDTTLFAVFDGEIKDIYSINPKTKEQFHLILLMNKEKGLKAYYSIKGEVTDKKEVKRGEVIATSNGETIQFLNGPFIFEMMTINETGEVKKTISSKDFVI